MTPWLSVLIPSNRPEGLTKFIDSLRSTSADFNSIEIVVLVDDYSRPSYIEVDKNIQTIHYPTAQPVNMSNLNYECYRHSSAPWVLIANDDLIMRTQNWDVILREKINQYPDEVALFYPNDNMFGEKLACFPIVSRKVLDKINFFPQPYQRYKFDDTLFDIYPVPRRIYLKDILLQHLNDQGEIGYRLDDGRIYPVEKDAAQYDSTLWILQHPERVRMKAKLLEMVSPNKEMKVLIAIPTQEMARRADFYDHFNLLKRPNDSLLVMAHGQSPAKNRNIMIDQALEHGCSHVFFIDDDVIIPPDGLLRLLAHNKDIISGLYLMRNFPHQGIVFHEAYDDGRCIWPNLTPEDKGVREIVAAGLGCCLIRTDVFRALERPYIRLGELEKDHWCDDLGFFKRVRDAGFKIYCDFDLHVGHMASLTIFPHRDENGNWQVSYDTFGPSRVSFPAPKIGSAEQKLAQEKAS